jgi:CubicO group peptidase (beta-lactamase class C family)
MLLFRGLLLCAATSVAQVSLAPLDAKHLASIDDFVNHEMARQRIPGLELGIYSRGRILLAKGYGLANVELNVPVKPETIMQSGRRQAVRLCRHHDARRRGQNLSR